MPCSDHYFACKQNNLKMSNLVLRLCGKYAIISKYRDLSDNSKPAERLGRKATGLKSSLMTMAAGLPKEIVLAFYLKQALFTVDGVCLFISTFH